MKRKSKANRESESGIKKKNKRKGRRGRKRKRRKEEGRKERTFIKNVFSNLFLKICFLPKFT